MRDLWPESAIDTGVLNSKLLIATAYAFERFIYKQAKLINVLTPAFRDKLIGEKGVPSGKVIFVPNAADFTLADTVQVGFDREAFRQNLGWSTKVVITYVGVDGVANHLEQILDTAALLRDERPEVLFVLIGGGMRKAFLQERARSEGLNNVAFIDSVPKSQVFRYILASDFGTSVLKRVDTFKTIYSNKTFDYMACRLPVLLAIDGVSRELVEKANCGRFIEPENPQDFAEVINFYLGLPREEWARQGQNGYDYATVSFDRKKLALQYLDYLTAAARGEISTLMIYIYGTGGFAREVANLLIENNEYSNFGGFVDLDAKVRELNGGHIFDREVIAESEYLAKSDAKLVIGIGDPGLRHKIVESLPDSVQYADTRTPYCTRGKWLHTRSRQRSLRHECRHGQRTVRRARPT